jgi:integrase
MLLSAIAAVSSLSLAGSSGPPGTSARVSSSNGGYLAPPTNKSWMSGAVERCQKADKTFPRITAHALRYTAASLAASAGANVKVVQRTLGHASAAMTLDVYAELFDDDFTQVADKLSETVGNLRARG